MPVFTLSAFIVLKLWILLIFQMVRHGGCLGLGLAAMGTARQGNNCLETNLESPFDFTLSPCIVSKWTVDKAGESFCLKVWPHCHQIFKSLNLVLSLNLNESS